jgi:hypothetical protein
MSEDLDSLIEDKEAQLIPLRSSMEQLKQEFLTQTIKFAAEWYKKTAKQYIAKYPEITLHMSEEQIANMKTQINTLVKNTAKNVKDVLDKPMFWWHQKPCLNDSIEQYMQVAERYPETLDRGVRQALGFLGVILEEHHFHVIANGNAVSYQEFWFAQAVGSHHTVPCYPHLLKWTEPMQDTIRDYSAVYVKAMKLYNEIQLLKEEKKRQDALSRWDSI